jgi:hypothetical protein
MSEMGIFRYFENRGPKFSRGGRWPSVVHNLALSYYSNDSDVGPNVHPQLAEKALSAARAGALRRRDISVR